MLSFKLEFGAWLINQISQSFHMQVENELYFSCKDLLVEVNFVSCMHKQKGNV